MKRTKRYGGFLIGDRVKHKKYGKGVVDGYFNGCIFVWFDKFVMNGDYFGSSIAPNQLINLTRIEEENKKIIDPLPPMSEETAKEIEERFYSFCGKHNITPPKANFNPAKEIDDLKAARDFVNEALRQTELFISSLNPLADLPSPYIRDVYTSSKDFD